MARISKARGVLDEIVAAYSTYQVTYRISGKTTATGDPRQRYEELISRLAAWQGIERGPFEEGGHTSTSAWIIRFRGTARELFAHLASAVTARYDLLEVIEVRPENEAKLPLPDKA